MSINGCIEQISGLSSEQSSIVYERFCSLDADHKGRKRIKTSNLTTKKARFDNLRNARAALNITQPPISLEDPLTASSNITTPMIVGLLNHVQG